MTQFYSKTYVIVFAFIAWFFPATVIVLFDLALWREILLYSTFGVFCIFGMIKNKRLSLTINGLFMGLTTIAVLYFGFYFISLSAEFQSNRTAEVILILIIAASFAVTSMLQCLFSETVRYNFYTTLLDKWLLYEIKQILSFLFLIALVLSFIFLGVFLAGPVGGLGAVVVCFLGHWYLRKRNVSNI